MVVRYCRSVGYGRLPASTDRACETWFKLVSIPRREVLREEADGRNNKPRT